MQRNILRFACAVAAALALFAAERSVATPPLKLEIHEKRLDNGLKVLVRVDHRVPVAVSMVWYRVGSIDETIGRTGVSHVLEHMMFKGTRSRGPGEFSRTIARAGGRDNAFTSRDYTAYHQRLHRDQLAIALELEADRMANLALNQEEFEKELRVVMEERRQRTEDNPQSLLYEQLMASAMLAEPSRNPIIGWMSDLQQLTLQDVSAWYETWYAPNNATLVVAGDVDPQQVFALAQRYFGPIASRALPKHKQPGEPPQTGVRRISVKAPAQLAQVAMAYRVPVLRDLEGDWEPYALSMLSAVLDGHDAARLPRTMVRESRVANAVDSSYDGIKRGSVGLFIVSGTPGAGHTVADMENAWRRQLAKLIDEGISEPEMKRVKTQLIAAEIYQQDSVFAQASQIGRFDALGLPLDTAERLRRKLEAVSAEQVREVARKYLVDDGLTVAVLDPQPFDPSRPPPTKAGESDEARH
jgi:zinc protease